MALAETGTRGLLGAALGSAADRDEASLARRLLPLLRPGMLVLLDRAFDANAFLGEVAATGALLLARAKSTRHPVVLGHLPDGSYLSQLGGLAVRVIEASVTVTGADGSRVRDGYRLITTLMDHRRFPAATVVVSDLGEPGAPAQLRAGPAGNRRVVDPAQQRHTGSLGAHQLHKRVPPQRGGHRRRRESGQVLRR